MNPVVQGFLLEEKIRDASLQFRDVIRSLGESEIKEYFKDKSLNGVDNYIQFNDYHILIQDKWREKASSQLEAAQFLTCVDKIKSRLSIGQKLYLIWACKTSPTSNATSDLLRKNVKIIVSDASIEVLTNKVMNYMNQIILQSYAMEVE